MNLNPRETIIIAILIFFLGKYITKKSAFLREYNIPEPVTGGILASLLFWLAHQCFGLDATFHLFTRDVLLLVFFTTVGLSARFSTLKQGGISLLILLVIALTYLFIQNTIGIGSAMAMGQHGIVGLLGGSLSLSGGHGTTIAWAPKLVQEYGINNAMEIGVACATFGLVLGGLIGGPIAHFLIRRHNLQSGSNEQLSVGFPHDEHPPEIDVENFLLSILMLSIAIGLAVEIKPLLESTGLSLPDFVICLFSGIIITNIVPLLLPRLHWSMQSPAMALIADLSLGLFLTISLMSLQLWTLMGLAAPIIVILLMQTVTITLFALFVVFPLLGKSYDAAVMVSGYTGLALGATPTAVANMTAVTERFGASPRAFIVVPLVGAFFIDIANAAIIKLFLHWLH